MVLPCLLSLPPEYRVTCNAVRSYNTHTLGGRKTIDTVAGGGNGWQTLPSTLGLRMNGRRCRWLEFIISRSPVAGANARAHRPVVHFAFILCARVSTATLACLYSLRPHRSLALVCPRSTRDKRVSRTGGRWWKVAAAAAANAFLLPFC